VNGMHKNLFFFQETRKNKCLLWTILLAYVGSCNDGWFLDGL